MSSEVTACKSCGFAAIGSLDRSQRRTSAWGVTLFDRLVADGRMPRPRRVDGRLIWLRAEIERAFEELPYDGSPRMRLRMQKTASRRYWPEGSVRVRLKHITQDREPLRQRSDLFQSPRQAKDPPREPVGTAAFMEEYRCAEVGIPYAQLTSKPAAPIALVKDDTLEWLCNSITIGLRGR